MNKYEQRVRQRAEEMAKINRTDRARKQYPWERLNDASKAAHIRWMIPIARISVQREAEAYRQGIEVADRNNEWTKEFIELELQSLGLVPENSK